MRKKPFFIAEISANHNGNLSLAKKLIKCAKSNGADVVKIQTYTADSMTIKSSKNILKLKKVYGKDMTYGAYMIKHTLQEIGTGTF